LTTKQKLVDVGPDDAYDTNAEHSFDEDDTFSPSPDRKAEIAQIGTKIQLSWHDINISAEPAPGRCGKKGVGPTKIILDGVSGCALPGQFISIIGASGAGKTTLLNHLSGRLIANNLTKTG
jgi:ABC-type multidrug transport system ATPase subunit